MDHLGINLWLLLIFAFSWIGITIGNVVPSDESLSETERIVNGRPAENNAFPFMAAIFYKDRFVCTASIISQRDILTAAHCVVFNGVQASPEDYSAIIGNVNKSSPATKVTFSYIAANPDFKNLQNDLAVMTTTEDMNFDAGIQPICLATSKIGCLTFKPVTAIGWGITTRDTDSTTTPDILQYTQLRVYPNVKCSALYLGIAPKTLMCAGALATGICSGDSGGPLVLKVDKKTYLQVGVAAFVNEIFGCARLLGPGGYTRVTYFTDFIKENTKGNVCFQA